MDRKISVLLSVYNGETYLPSALNSICSQTYENFEFLIMDDCSNDNSYEVLNEFKKIDSRIKLFKNKNNLGLTKSLNILISEATGEYYARQDVDDISLVQRFEKQIDILINENYAACTTRAIIREDTRITPNKSFYLPKPFVMNLKNPFVHGSLMITKEALISVGGYNELFYYAQDYKLMSDLLEAKQKIKIIKDPHYILNIKDNISTNYKEQQQYYADCVRKKIQPEKIK